MIQFEWKKIMNWKIAFSLTILFVLYGTVCFVQYKGIAQGSHTAIKEELYKEIGGKISAEKEEKIVKEKNKSDNVLGQEWEMEEKYNKGQIEMEEYMNYRDLYHDYYNKYKVINDIYDRYMAEKNRSNYMVFDAYYNQLFRKKYIHWGLILSIVLISVLLNSCESKRLIPVICDTKRGIAGIWRAKYQLMLLFCVVFTFLYSALDLGIYCSFSKLEYLNAPVQSISCLAKVPFPFSIAQWIVVTFILNATTMCILGVILLVLQFVLKNASYLLQSICRN